MNDLIHGFIDEQSDEEKALRQKSMDAQSSEGGVIELKVSGTYLMEVSTFAYADKKRNNEMRVSPEAYVSEKKKSLNLNINLKVVDGTPHAPKGSSVFMNLTLSPAKGATRDKIDNVNRMLKPQLVVLTGVKNPQITAEWIEEYLMAKYEEKDGQFVLVKDHKMKEKFLAVIEDDVYNDKDVLSVKKLLQASKGSKSVSNVPIQEDTQNVAQPSPNDFGNINAESVIDEDDTNNSDAIPDVPDQAEDFND